MQSRDGLRRTMPKKNGKIQWDKVPPGSWYTPPARHSWRQWHGKWSGGWTPDAKDMTKVTCSECNRWVYAYKLERVNHECLCGAKFAAHRPDRQGKGAKSDKDEEYQVAQFMQHLAKQSGPKAEAAKSYLEAAKAKNDKEKPPAATVAEVTARVTKAESAFKKAQQNKAKLLKSIAEADDRIRETAEALAKAEAQRYTIFKTVVPDKKEEPAKPKIQVADLIKGEVPIDYGCTVDLEALDEKERAEVESRVQAVKDLLHKAAMEAFNPILAEIERRKKEVAETYKQVVKRRRVADEETPATVAVEEGEAPKEQAQEAPKEQPKEASKVEVSDAEIATAGSGPDDAAKKKLGEERFAQAELKVQTETSAILEQFRQQYGGSGAAPSSG